MEEQILFQASEASKSEHIKLIILLRTQQSLKFWCRKPVENIQECFPATVLHHCLPQSCLLLVCYSKSRWNEKIQALY